MHSKRHFLNLPLVSLPFHKSLWQGKPIWSARGKSFEKMAVSKIFIILFRQRILKMLIRLCSCTVWSAPLLFAYTKTTGFHLTILVCKRQSCSFLEYDWHCVYLNQLFVGTNWSNSSKNWSCLLAFSKNSDQLVQSYYLICVFSGENQYSIYRRKIKGLPIYFGLWDAAFIYLFFLLFLAWPNMCHLVHTPTTCQYKITQDLVGIEWTVSQNYLVFGPVFGVSDKVRFKPACSATETS